MQQEQYDLVFVGELAKGFELAQVKRNLQSLFRLDSTKIDKLFSGREVTLKKGVSLEAANNYRVAMKKAGALINLVESTPSDSSAQEARTPRTSTPTSTPTSTSTVETLLGAQPARPAEVRASIEAPDYDIANLGTELLEPHERPRTAPVSVDISALSVKEPAGNLVDPQELTRPAPVSVAVPELDLAPPGSDVLKESERKKVAEVSVDLSGLSVAEPGTRLSAERKDNATAPNVDHIRLAE